MRHYTSIYVRVRHVSPLEHHHVILAIRQKRHYYDPSAQTYLQHKLVMEISKPLNASPQGSGVDGDATNVPIHETDNGFRRKRLTTTPVTVAGAATRDTRYTEPHATESQDSNNNHERSPEPEPKKRKIDHAIQQEADEEVIREAPLSLPIYSLARRGRLSARSDIIPYTRELDHDATVTAITREEDGVLVCRINIHIVNTADSCTGFCKIPVAGMDRGLADWYRTRPDLAEDLELEAWDFLRPGSSG